MRRRGGCFGAVLGLAEFRALYLARLLSLSGDQVAKVALAVAIYRRSGSALLAAATFAAGFLPWVIAGPVLSVVADRYRRRDVMVACDLARAVLVAAIALPGLPLPVLFALLVAMVSLAAPFEAARAGLLPEVLPDDGYVVGSSLGQAATQGAQVLGYLCGGVAVALLTPSGALVLDAVTFVASAALVLKVRRGAAPQPPERRPRLATELRGGAGVVLASPVLRAMVAVAWMTSVFLIVPEGLAIACASDLGGARLLTVLLVAAVPAGNLAGALAIARVRPARRRIGLICPLAVLTAVPLVATALRPAGLLVMACWMLAGLGGALHVPALATFVVHTPPELRGRAFGLAESGLQAVQGAALLVAGALATVVPATTVVAGAGACGVAAALLLRAWWPAEVRSLARPAPAPLAVPVGGISRAAR
ncbi:MAG: MFS transporter [Frankiaceae bacterium]